VNAFTLRSSGVSSVQILAAGQMVQYGVPMGAKEDNIQAFRSKLPELLTNPLLRGKFVVVHAKEVKASFDTFDAALRHAVANYPTTEFIVQRVIEDSATINYLRPAI